MPELDDPELEDRLDELADEGTIYQIINPEVVRYVIERGRHCFGVAVDVESKEWENITGASGDLAEWMCGAIAVHEIEEWGDD